MATFIYIVRSTQAMGRLSRGQRLDARKPVSPQYIHKRYTLIYVLIRTSADGESQANMTNLAFKGIIGVKAMGEISQEVGESSDAQTYAVRPFISVRRAWAQCDPL